MAYPGIYRFSNVYIWRGENDRVLIPQDEARTYQVSDQRITKDIIERLMKDPDVDASGITVETGGGEVILKGTVTDRKSKRRAEEIAHSCSGVLDVQNQLRIRRLETPS